MRLLVTMLIALVGSFLAGNAAAVLLTEFVWADASFALVFAGVGPVALIVLIIFVVMSRRADPVAAIDRAGGKMLRYLAIGFAAFGIVELMLSGVSEQALRGIYFILAVALSSAAVIAGQWLVFRKGIASSAEPAAAPPAA